MTAMLKVKGRDESKWWNVLAFAETIQDALLCLQDGDSISAQRRAPSDVEARKAVKKGAPWTMMMRSHQPV
jgi:hypothetical protein